jgi:hypothetical protein
MPGTAGSVMRPSFNSGSGWTRTSGLKGFQTSEFLLEHGFIDRIVARKDLKSEIARAIDYCGG